MTTKTLQKWHADKIGNLGKVVTGKTPPTAHKEFFGGEFPFITPSDIGTFDVRYLSETERTVTELWAFNNKKYILPHDAIVYVCIGSTVGKIGLTARESITNQQINSLVADSNKLVPKYGYYLLRNITPEIQQIASARGAGKGIINKTQFEDFDVSLPSTEDQKHIADVLSTYDDLIENNVRRIKILEQIAQAIYKEWFVYFRFPDHEKVKMIDSKTDLGKIPTGWAVKSILDIKYFKFINENIKKFKGSKIYYATADMNGIMISGEGENVTFEDKPSRAQKEPIVFSVWFARMKDTFKVLGFTESNGDIAKNSILSSGFAGFCSDKLFFPFLYYTINSDIFHKIKDLHCTGATQMALTNDSLEKIAVLEPSDQSVINYGNKILPLINEIFLLQKQNRNLRQARDLLLPKLVTGEIEVKT